MQLNYIKNILNKYEKENFSGLLEEREYKIKLFSLPLSVLIGISLSYVTNLFLGIESIIQDNDYINLYLFVWIFIVYHSFRQSYLIIKGIKSFKFDNKLKIKYSDLFEIYDKVFFIKYTDSIKEDNPFPYFLTDINNIDDKEIQSYINDVQFLEKINIR